MAIGANGAVLDTAQSESDAFRVTEYGLYQIRCSIHAGGVWTLQERFGAGDPWTDTDTSVDRFRSTGSDAGWQLMPDREYRFAGGTRGARIHVAPTSPGQGGPQPA